MSLERITATRFLKAMDEGGSRPALVKADDGRTYVVKLRGAAQGVSPLAAEMIVGEIARLPGLRIPKIVLVDITVDFPEGESDLGNDFCVCLDGIICRCR